MSLEVHAQYSLPADRELWAQAISGADAAIEEAALPHEHEWRIIEPGCRTLVFEVPTFYVAFTLKERIEAVGLHGITVRAEIRE